MSIESRFADSVISSYDLINDAEIKDMDPVSKQILITSKLTSEAGELSELPVKRRWYKGDEPKDVYMGKVMGELADTLYMLVAAADTFGVTMEELYSYAQKKFDEKNKINGII